MGKNQFALTNLKTQNILPDSDLICFIVPSLFSKAECKKFLNNNIRNSFQEAITNYPTHYRNNERTVINDNDLSSYLFKQVKPFLPKTLEINSSIESENGIWHLKKLNNRLRFCKYSSNQYFKRHLDGIHYEDYLTQSKLTFMIYLNDATEFKGGKTLFFENKNTNKVWASYIPKQGDLIVFDHNVWHEGEILTQGEKFVLRSDILYSKKKENKNLQPFYGHLGYIWSLLKNSDEIILSGGRDKEIKVWTNLGKLKTSLKGHLNSVLCIEKINNNIFISGSRDKQIIVWKNYKILNKIKIHSAVILSLCRLTNNTFVSSSGDNTIKIVKLNGRVLKTFDEHSNWVWQTIKINNYTLASCSEDCSIKIWNINNEKSIYTFHETSPIISITFNNHTKQLISGNLNGEITIRTLKNDFSLSSIKTFQAHSETIRTIKILNNNYIASGGEDNSVKIWNLKGNLISTFKHLNFVQSVETLNSNTLISASYDGTIKTWDIESLTKIND